MAGLFLISMRGLGQHGARGPRRKHRSPERGPRYWLAQGSCLTRSLALFTLMILAASERPVDFSVHLCTWPNRPLPRQDGAAG